MSRRGSHGRPPWKRFIEEVQRLPDPRRSCEDKKKLTITEAQEICRRERHLRWYECDHCNGIHMTSVKR